jgi:hypothetical protein
MRKRGTQLVDDETKSVCGIPVENLEVIFNKSQPYFPYINNP